jgi:hypothetical protein
VRLLNDWVVLRSLYGGKIEGLDWVALQDGLVLYGA